jgi:4'-phosphopantetheinyl transferase
MIPTLSIWSSPPNRPKLADGEVHLWRFRLDLSPDKIAELTQHLDSDERHRSERLLDRSKADSFIVARARMRQILARYLELTPNNIVFTYGEQGKPELADQHDQTLKFNLAHAGYWGVVALTIRADVGVDMEQIDQKLDYDKIAKNIFSADEIDRLQNTPILRRRRNFYRMWTRKEARLKLLGTGFSIPSAPVEKTQEQLKSFTIGRKYLGVIAISKELINLSRWNLPNG